MEVTKSFTLNVNGAIVLYSRGLHFLRVFYEILRNLNTVKENTLHFLYRNCSRLCLRLLSSGPFTPLWFFSGDLIVIYDSGGHVMDGFAS